MDRQPDQLIDDIEAVVRSGTVNNMIFGDDELARLVIEYRSMKQKLEHRECKRRLASEATERVREFFNSWQGGALNAEQVADAVGLTLDKKIYNALTYLVRSGQINKAGRGMYQN